MDVTEVTVKAYKACVEAGACTARTTVLGDWYEKNGGEEKWSQACNYGKEDRGEHPMNCVDWSDADKYCKWAGKRLPTEEEWEYAARGTANRKYPWGSDAPSAQRLNACGPECIGWFKSNIGNDEYSTEFTESDLWPTTAPVGQFPLGDTPWGLHDMAGNVWEWMSSNYCPYGVALCSEQARVARGGSWSGINPSYVRAADRVRDVPSKRDVSLGFRCAR